MPLPKSVVGGCLMVMFQRPTGVGFCLLESWWIWMLDSHRCIVNLNIHDMFSLFTSPTFVIFLILQILGVKLQLH